jgi:hypothetical protein
MRVLARGKTVTIRLEDKSSGTCLPCLTYSVHASCRARAFLHIMHCHLPPGELFAEAKMTEYPSPVIEPVQDSSRYFAMMIENEQGIHGTSSSVAGGILCIAALGQSNWPALSQGSAHSSALGFRSETTRSISAQLYKIIIGMQPLLAYVDEGLRASGGKVISLSCGMNNKKRSREVRKYVGLKPKTLNTLSRRAALLRHTIILFHKEAKKFERRGRAKGNGNDQAPRFVWSRRLFVPHAGGRRKRRSCGCRPRTGPNPRGPALTIP